MMNLNRFCVLAFCDIDKVVTWLPVSLTDL